MCVRVCVCVCVCVRACVRARARVCCGVEWNRIGVDGCRYDNLAYDPARAQQVEQLTALLRQNFDHDSVVTNALPAN